MPNQNSNHPDGKFPATAPIKSPAFGQCGDADKGAVPGKAQDTPPAGAGRAD